MTRRTPRILILSALLLAAACGGGDTEASHGGPAETGGAQLDSAASARWEATDAAVQGDTGLAREHMEDVSRHEQAEAERLRQDTSAAP
jgi:hypothetical protein